MISSSLLTKRQLISKQRWKRNSYKLNPSRSDSLTSTKSYLTNFYSLSLILSLSLSMILRMSMILSLRKIDFLLKKMS